MNEHDNEYDAQQSADWVGDAICGHVTHHTFLMPRHESHKLGRHGIPLNLWVNWCSKTTWSTAQNWPGQLQQIIHHVGLGGEICMP